MNGGMSESKNDVADLKDVDVATFTHFSKWLYTGQYDLHDFGQLEHKPSLYSEEDHYKTKSIPWDYGLTTKEKKKKEKAMKLDGTWEERVTEIIETVPEDNWTANFEFSGRRSKKQEAWEAFTHQSAYALAPPPRTNGAANYPDLTEDFLGHAKLYCFADIYNIVPLQDLCLGNLKTCLIGCECQETQVQAIVRLIAYTIDNTPSVSVQNAENLRSVVLDFAVITFELLIRSETFKELLETDNGLAKQLLLLLGRRLD